MPWTWAFLITATITKGNHAYRIDQSLCIKFEKLANLLTS